ncbi:hypothetical protein CO024_02345, partial [Candidatus Gracilibacteria bacterium CG_4_9_14_0_2_um_filter_38_7]
MKENASGKCFSCYLGIFLIIISKLSAIPYFVMSKKIKVSIQDENTLVLLEDASKGDLIDLKSIHETDIDKTSIVNIVNSIKRDKFQEELKKETDRIEREHALQQELKEKDWRETEQRKLQEKEKEINELRIKYSNVETEKKLAITEAKSEIEKDRDRL